jgi:methylenetetrahydrofolate reductase (NADPH)
MKITELLKGRGLVFSLEFFPPKTEEATLELYKTLREVKKLNPAYISVTYGAGGSTRDKTVEIVKRAKNEIGLETMAHLTCLGHSRQEIRNILDDLSASAIENVIALRGDPPKGQANFVPTPSGFAHADELTAFIRASYTFCIAVAGYPEGHIESPDKVTDWNNLYRKINAGADFVISQLFFNNEYFFEFEQAMRAKGVTVPIVPGIMPITNYHQIVKFTEVCGATIPSTVMQDLAAIQNDSDAVQKYGVKLAVEQCRGLIAHGVPEIHFYTLNKSTATREVIERLTKSAL